MSAYFFQRPTHRTFEFWIDHLYPAVLPPEGDDHGDILEDRLEKLLLLSQFIFGTLSLRDVPPDGNDRPVGKMHDCHGQIYDSPIPHPHFAVNPLTRRRGNEIQNPLAILRVGIKLGK